MLNQRQFNMPVPENVQVRKAGGKGHLEGDKSLLHLERILANVSLNKPSAGLYKLHLDQVHWEILFTWG